MEQELDVSKARISELEETMAEKVEAIDALQASEQRLKDEKETLEKSLDEMQAATDSFHELKEQHDYLNVEFERLNSDINRSGELGRFTLAIHLACIVICEH